jgi:hypothetical protein
MPLQNPYNDPTAGREGRTLSDGTVDYTSPYTQPGVVASEQETQGSFDKARGQGPQKPGAMENGAAGAAQTAANGGSADQVVSSGLIASGNPYAMAAGLTLSAVNANQQAEYQRQVAQREAELQTQQRLIKSSNEAVSAYDRMRNLV